MKFRSLVICMLIVQFVAPSFGEEVSSKEYGFSVTTPESADWKVIQNGVAGERNPSYVLAIANPQQRTALSYFSLPMGKDAVTGKVGTTLEDVKEGFEKGVLAKADGKVSSADIELAGRKAYRIVALKKLPNGEERHHVTIIFVAKGRTNAIGGMTKIPWDKDENLARFIESLKVEDR